MSNINKNLDSGVILSYISSCEDKIDLKIFLGLYRNYFMLINSNMDINDSELLKLEDSVYTYKEKKLNNYSRIKYSYDMLQNKISLIDDDKIKGYALRILDEIKKYFEYDNEEFEEYANYLKSLVVKAQILLDYDCSFYYTICRMFNNEYNSLVENFQTGKVKKI